MIKMNVFKNNGYITGLELSGHAEYSEPGSDIVCAAVSVLVINVINSIEKLTDDLFDCSLDEQGGFISFTVFGQVSNEAHLLLQSMLLGIEKIRDDYGSEYIDLIIEEV